MGVELTKRWFEHYPEEVPKTIEYDNKPLHEFLVETATNYPDKTAIHFMGKELTYQEVYDAAKKFASYLQYLGLKKGDRVAVMLPNTPQSVISYYGALLAGGVVVQTNPLYTERELEYQLKDSGAKIIVCLDILLPRAENVKDDTYLENIIVTAIKDYLPFPKNLIYPFIQKREYNMVVKPEHSGDTHVWTTMLEEASGEYTKHEVDPEEDLALLQYTGGTTGYPKGVMLTHLNLVSNTQMCEKWNYKAEYGKETVLGILPFFHVYGMTAVMNLSVMMAQKMILVPKFDVDTVLKLIDKQRPTLFPGAPTIYIGLLNHPKLSNYDLSSINACLSGSAPLPAEVQQQFEKVTGGKLVEGYGLTESSPVTHSNLIYENRRAGTIGLPWPDTDAKVFKPDTLEEMPIGEVGEIAVKGPQIMKGYWNRPEETENTLKDGWLLTGDMGYMDEEGYFYIVDRKKDMIIAGGFNIYPREVEEVLYENELIAEAVVAGIPDPYRGETVKAYVVLKEGADLTEEGLDQYCRENLAAFKVPKRYEFRTELPKTAVGKILRRKLVDEEKEKLQNQV
ncbi:long-chain-fatty-acid--CoA ligase [Tenuibacillus multivorans]|uniref:Long-chain acyl-CoA synthetase n=1 Tax=Tenuibacillus multivorans TaxID=237069 RepID=A0A1G9ZQN7_9BACI|nr:long-chain-fatty-acid--CoA ligase [Tenuibacillus multivorans]GEL76811.1 long-chain-fatty-acid--CoA ligase [Tenuibacillus multivorans]SDN23494.1 long-chain acyl-CoA synthetase [Tenuibacillus multivorans]